MDITRTLRRFALPLTIASVIIILLALGGWYYYLDGKRALLSAVESGRGLSESLISGFPVGSTYTNITNALGNAFGTDAAGTGSTSRAPTLWLAAGAPSAGITWVSASGAPVLRFLDRASGNVFDANPETTSVVRRTNTLLPKVVEAVWAGEETVIARFDGSGGVETFSATIKPSTTTSESVTKEGPGILEGSALPRGITAITSEPEGERIFYLIPYNGIVAGITARADGSSVNRVWQFPITGWLPQWAGDHILLSQKPAGGIAGSVYRLSLSGAATPLVSEVPGLFAKEHPDGGPMLYSAAPSQGAPSLFVRTPSGSVQQLPFATLADKCAWDPSNTARFYCAVPSSFASSITFPDAWYRGEVHFDDSIWMFDLSDGSVAQIYSPATGSGQSLDILDPVISPDGAYMAFIDATTGSAWILRLE